MLERVVPALALVLLPAALRWTLPETHASRGPEPALLALLPAETLGVVDAPGIAALAERGLDDPALRAILDGGLNDLLFAEHGAGAAELLARVDAAVGHPLLADVAALASDGACLGVGFQRGGLAWTLALRGRDPELLRAVLADGFAYLEAEYDLPPGAIEHGRRRRHGADVWDLGEELKIAARGGLLIATNGERLMNGALERAAGDGEVLLSDELLEALPPRDGGTVAVAALNLAPLDALASLGGAKKLKSLRRLPRDPGAQLVFGSGLADLGAAGAVGVALRMDGTRVGLSVIGSGGPRTEALAPAAGGLAPPALAPNARDVARLLVHRDLAAAFTERVNLFPPEVGPKFAKVETDLALFFGGADLGREVLPGIAPWGRVVVREVPFEEGRVPENPLPAAALVLALREPEEHGPRLTSAFQTLVGLLNIERAQEGDPAFLLQLASLGPEAPTLSLAQLPAPCPEDGVDAIYNLVPACVQVGDLFVLATHAGLARELALELQGRAATPQRELTEELSIDGAAAARIIAANRETLAVRNMLDKGHSLEAAHAEVEMFERLVGLVDALRIDVHHGEALRVDLTLEIASGGDGGMTR